MAWSDRAGGVSRVQKLLQAQRDGPEGTQVIPSSQQEHVPVANERCAEATQLTRVQRLLSAVRSHGDTRLGSDVVRVSGNEFAEPNTPLCAGAMAHKKRDADARVQGEFRAAGTPHADQMDACRGNDRQQALTRVQALRAGYQVALQNASKASGETNSAIERIRASHAKRKLSADATTSVCKQQRVVMTGEAEGARRNVAQCGSSGDEDDLGGHTSDLSSAAELEMDTILREGEPVNTRKQHDSNWKSWVRACSHHNVQPWRRRMPSNKRQRKQEILKIAKVLLTVYALMAPRSHADPAPRPASMVKVWYGVRALHVDAGYELPEASRMIRRLQRAP